MSKKEIPLVEAVQHTMEMVDRRDQIYFFIGKLEEEALESPSIENTETRLELERELDQIGTENLPYLQVVEAYIAEHGETPWY